MNLPIGRNLARRLALLLVFVAIFGVAPAQSATYFSGHVTDSQGSPVAGANIQAGFTSINGGLGWTFVIDGQATSNAQGDYAITTLDAANTSGQYVLVVRTPGYVLTINPNRYCTDDSCLETGALPTVPVSTVVDFTLLHSASISGTVTRTDTNTPVGGAQLDARTSTPGYLGYGPETGSAESGAFAFNNLPPGTYHLWAQPARLPLLNQAYAQHDYDDTLAPIYDSITLQEGQNVSSADFPLHPGATISGTLTSAVNAAPVPAFIELARIDPNALPGYIAVSGGTSAYVTRPLAPGSFHAQFGNGDEYLPLFYPHTADEAQAQMLTLSLGQHLNGIDAQLTPTRSIAGTVTDATTSAPLQGVVLHAATYTNLFGFLFDWSDAVTDASGHYLLQGLSSGTQSQYYVWADQVRGYIYQFYPSATPCCTNPVAAGATQISLGASEYRTGVDLPMHAGAYGSGRIYDPDTNFAGAAMTVNVLDANGNILSRTVSDAAGNYFTPGLPPNNYYVNVNLSPVSVVYYPNYACTYPDCVLANAQQLAFNVVQEYPNLDIAVAHLDLIFRGGFGQ